MDHKCHNSNKWFGTNLTQPKSSYGDIGQYWIYFIRMLDEGCWRVEHFGNIFHKYFGKYFGNIFQKRGWQWHQHMKLFWKYFSENIPEKRQISRWMGRKRWMTAVWKRLQLAGSQIMVLVATVGWIWGLGKYSGYRFQKIFQKIFQKRGWHQGEVKSWYGGNSWLNLGTGNCSKTCNRRKPMRIGKYLGEKYSRSYSKKMLTSSLMGPYLQ